MKKRAQQSLIITLIFKRIPYIILLILAIWSILLLHFVSSKPDQKWTSITPKGKDNSAIIGNDEMGLEKEVDNKDKYAELEKNNVKKIRQMHNSLFKRQKKEGTLHEKMESYLKETIFIGIASYRDTACPTTVWDAFIKATQPERIKMGIFEQNDPDDIKCLHLVETKCKEETSNELKNWDIKAACDAFFSGRIKVESIDFREAKGPTWGRAQVEKLYTGEDFYLQIDSHSIFKERWDVLLTNMWGMINNERAIISNYPAGHVKRDSKVGVMCRAFFGKNDMVRNDNKDSVEWSPYLLPGLQPFWAAGFSFGKGHVLEKVPYDPFTHYVFDGEEFSMAARLFTHGYDLYFPTENVIYHVYDTNKQERPHKFWELDWNKKAQIKKKSENRIKTILKIPFPSDSFDVTDIDRYGIGDKRTLEQFYEFAQVDVANKQIADRCDEIKSRKIQRIPLLTEKSG